MAVEARLAGRACVEGCVGWGAAWACIASGGGFSHPRRGRPMTAHTRPSPEVRVEGWGWVEGYARRLIPSLHLGGGQREGSTSSS